MEYGLREFQSGDGITLSAVGFLVSGQLVGGKEYFEGFASDFASGFGDTSAAEDIKAALSRYGEIYSSGDDEPPPPTYIHIKSAKFFHNSGKPIPGNRGVWWRGRISEVAGFSLGELKFEDS